MKQFNSSIMLNKEIAKDYYQMNFQWNSREIPKPGQFFTVKVNNSTSPLLRRPFAFSGFDKDNNTASMIYQKRGQTTQLMAGKSPGDSLDIIGPLGNYFPKTDARTIPVLIAGGIGLGPVLYFAQTLKAANISYILIFGAPQRAFIPDAQCFHETNPIICTDDGSQGFQGNPIQYIETSLKANPDYSFFTCGPMGMLKAAAQLAENMKLQSFSVMEQVMACGVGACMGCVINHKEGFKRVCVDGPVFKSKDIIWT